MPVRARSRCSSEAIHSLPCRAGLLELAQVRVPALPDQAAFLQGERRLVLQGLFKEFLKVRERSDLLGERAQEGAVQGSEGLREPRQAAQEAPQGDEVAGVGHAEGRAAGEPLQVPHALQAPPQPVPGGRGVHQGGHRLLAAEDGLAVEQRAKHPLAEQAGAHRACVVASSVAKSEPRVVRSCAVSKSSRVATAVGSSSIASPVTRRWIRVRCASDSPWVSRR